MTLPPRRRRSVLQNCRPTIRVHRNDPYLCFMSTNPLQQQKRFVRVSVTQSANLGLVSQIINYGFRVLGLLSIRSLFHFVACTSLLSSNKSVQLLYELEKRLNK